MPTDQTSGFTLEVAIIEGEPTPPTLTVKVVVDTAAEELFQLTLDPAPNGEILVDLNKGLNENAGTWQDSVVNGEYYSSAYSGESFSVTGPDRLTALAIERLLVTDIGKLYEDLDLGQDEIFAIGRQLANLADRVASAIVKSYDGHFERFIEGLAPNAFSIHALKPGFLKFFVGSTFGGRRRHQMSVDLVRMKRMLADTTDENVKTRTQNEIDRLLEHMEESGVACIPEITSTTIFVQGLSDENAYGESANAILQKMADEAAPKLEAKVIDDVRRHIAQTIGNATFFREAVDQNFPLPSPKPFVAIKFTPKDGKVDYEFLRGFSNVERSQVARIVEDRPWIFGGAEIEISLTPHGYNLETDADQDPGMLNELIADLDSVFTSALKWEVEHPTA